MVGYLAAAAVDIQAVSGVENPVNNAGLSALMQRRKTLSAMTLRTSQTVYAFPGKPFQMQ